MPARARSTAFWNDFCAVAAKACSASTPITGIDHLGLLGQHRVELEARAGACRDPHGEVERGVPVRGVDVGDADPRERPGVAVPHPGRCDPHGRRAARQQPLRGAAGEEPLLGGGAARAHDDHGRVQFLGEVVQTVGGRRRCDDAELHPVVVGEQTAGGIENALRRWCLSAVHSASTRPEPIGAGDGCTVATTSLASRNRLQARARTSPSSADGLPSNPATTAPSALFGGAPMGLSSGRACRSARRTPASGRGAGVSACSRTRRRSAMPMASQTTNRIQVANGRSDIRYTANGHADQREHGRERDAVRPRHVGTGPPEDDHADVDQHEGEQGADVDQFDDRAERHQGGQDGDQQAQPDG